MIDEEVVEVDAVRVIFYETHRSLESVDCSPVIAGFYPLFDACCSRLNALKLSVVYQRLSIHPPSQPHLVCRGGDLTSKLQKLSHFYC